MAKNPDPFWMEKAFANAHGQLRKKVGGKVTIKKAEAAKKGASTKTKRQANLAITAARIRARKKPAYAPQG